MVRELGQIGYDLRCIRFLIVQANRMCIPDALPFFMFFRIRTTTALAQTQIVRFTIRAVRSLSYIGIEEHTIIISVLVVTLFTFYVTVFFG